MTIDLNDQQVGYLLQVLAQRPYGEVCELVSVIHRQAQQQAQQAHAFAAMPAMPHALNGTGEPRLRKDESPDA